MSHPVEVDSSSLGNDVAASGAIAEFPSSRRTLPQFAAALAGYVVATIVAMWPVLSNYSNTVMGASVQPNDDTAGGVWLVWQALSHSPFAAHTSMLNAPTGTFLWRAVDVTALGWIIPVWLLAHVFGPIGGWNIMVALGFVADGLAMFALARWLLGSTWVAFVAGLLYSFSAFHLVEASTNIGYLQSWIFPLILWAGLAFLRRPTLLASILFGVSIASATYIDGYYILFAPLLAAILVACGLLGSRSLGIKPRRLLSRALLSALSYVLLIAPAMAAYITGSGQVTESFRGFRPEASVYNESAHLWEYVVPWRISMFVRVREHTAHGSKLVSLAGLWGQGPREGAIYVGLVVLLLAASLWIGLVRKTQIAAWRGLSLPTPFTGWTLLAIATVSVVCSLPSLGPLPGLPIIIFKVVPFWRAYVRLFVVVDCAVVAGAAVTIAYLARFTKPWLAVLLAIAAVADACPVVPWYSWSYAAQTSAPYHWLAAHQDGGIVAEYPLTSDRIPLETYLTLQVVHRHPLFNGAPAGTTRAQIQRALADLSDPETVSILKYLDVRYVLIHQRFFTGHRNLTLHPTGLLPIVSGNGDTLYRFGRTKPPIGTLTVKSGFDPEMPDIPHIHRFMSASRATLGIIPFTRWRHARFSFLATSYRKPRHLWVSQNHRVLWSGLVSSKGPASRINVPIGRHGSLVFNIRPGPVANTAYWGGKVSVDIFDIALTPPLYHGHHSRHTSGFGRWLAG